MSYVKIARFSILPARWRRRPRRCSRSQATPAPARRAVPTVSASSLSKPLRDSRSSPTLEPVTTFPFSRALRLNDSAQFAEGAHVKKGQLLFRIDARRSRPRSTAGCAGQGARQSPALAATNRDRGNQLIAKHVIAQQD
jgi:multidrug efflux pump subunit AcrA (membrane-fusion protein)